MGSAPTQETLRQASATASCPANEGVKPRHAAVAVGAGGDAAPGGGTAIALAQKEHGGVAGARAHHRVRLHLLVVLAVDAGATGDVRGAEQAQEGLAGGHVGQGQRREVDTLRRGGLGGERAREPVAGRVDEVLDEDVGARHAGVVDADGGVVGD